MPAAADLNNCPWVQNWVSISAREVQVRHLALAAGPDETLKALQNQLNTVGKRVGLLTSWVGNKKAVRKKPWRARTSDLVSPVRNGLYFDVKGEA